MLDAVRRAISPVVRRVMAMAARCRVQNADESTGRQRLQLSGLTDEVLDQVEMIGHYGFTSCPLPGALAAVVFPSGARDSGFVVGTDDSRYRPKGLRPGEVCIYTNNGGQILIQDDGVITIVTGGGSEMKITASSVTIFGDLVVSGSIVSAGINLTTHVHGGVQAGGSNTAGPH